MKTERAKTRSTGVPAAILLLLSLAIGRAGLAQTATDACTPLAGNQYSVSLGTSCSWQTFDKEGSFGNAYEPNTCSSQQGGTSRNDAWGWFTAVNTTTTVTFDPLNNNRPILHVFTGTCGGTLTQMACHNSGSNGVNATVTFTSVIGQVYFVRVQRHNTDADMDGSICILSPKGTDSCTLTASNEFSVASSCTFQPFNKPAAYTSALNPGTCGSGAFNDSWGWFTATGTQTVLTFDPNGSERPILHVFSGSCGSLVAVGCVDAGSNGANAELAIATTIGLTYIVRLQRQGASTLMDGQLCVWSPSSTNSCAFDAQNQFTQTTTCGFQAFQKPEAYTSAMNPGGCSSGANDDAWGWFTATATNTVITFDPDLSDRPILHVFSGSCGSLVQIGCHDSGANGVNAEVVLTTVIGQNYAFRVQRQGSNAFMNGTICILAPRSTNSCAFIAQNQFTSTSTCSFQAFQKPEGYSSAMNPGGCSSGAFDDAWGWFTATGTTTFITYDPDNSHRPILHVFSGTCGSLVQVGCVDAGSTGANAELMLATTVGQNYAFRIQRQGSSTAMDGRICVYAPTTTDVCSYAGQNQFSVTAGCTFQAFDKPTLFTASSNPGGCNSSSHDDAWGWFTATSTSTAITYDPSSSHRPIMHVFSGACGSLVQVACNDGGAGGINAEVNITTVIGQNYMIRIQRHNDSNAMDGDICIRPSLSNDECGTATVLPVIATCFSQTFSNDRATRSTTTPAATCGGTINNNTQQDVWFSFVAPGSGQVLIETAAGTMTDAVMQLYSGSCGSLVALACDDNSGPGSMPRIDRTCNLLNPGETYYLRIWGDGGERGTFELCVSGPDTFTPRQEDCVNAALVCGDQGINNSARDRGCTQDLSNGNRGCLVSNERQGSWYYFTIAASGTMAFTIRPTANVDYDYAVWGPLASLTCPPPSAPARCSYAYPPNVPGFPAASAYLTGLRAADSDLSEADGGGVNGFTAPMTVVAGQVYMLYVDNFDVTGQAFILDWDLSNGCSIDCNVLPVELFGFTAQPASDHVALEWTTLTEQASSHFIVERSGDGDHFTPIGSLAAAGHSLERISYLWNDTDPLNGTAYYRLRQVDLDGSIKYSDVVSATMRSGSGTLTLYPNPASDRITIELPQANVTGTSTIELLDASGRLLRTDQYALEEGQRSISLFVQDLEPGSYLVRAFANNGLDQSIGRFVKH